MVDTFIKKCKKIIITHVNDMTDNYISLIRPSDKKNILDDHAKNQLIYILYELINIVKRVEVLGSDISNIIKTNVKDGYAYNFYKFMLTIAHEVEYTYLGEPIESELLMVISESIFNEDVAQHVVQLYLIFLKFIAQIIANFSHAGAKRISGIHMNSFIRIADQFNSNPAIFEQISKATISLK